MNREELIKEIHRLKKRELYLSMEKETLSSLVEIRKAKIKTQQARIAELEASIREHYYGSMCPVSGDFERASKELWKVLRGG